MTITLPDWPRPARVAAVIAVCAAALSLRYGGGLEPLKAAASQAAAAPSNSLEILEEGLLAECNIREIGVAGYPEGHPAISSAVLESALQKKISLAREQKLGLYAVTQFSFSPARIIDYCANLARTAPGVSVYVGIAGPTDPIALARYAQRCGVSASLRALRKLGTGIARLVTHTDPREHVMAVARYSMSREPSNVAGMHLYSFGGAVRTATWMSELIAG